MQKPTKAELSNALKTKGVYFLGYGIMPKSVALNRELSLDSKLVYAHLSCYADKQGTAYPSQNRIARELNIGEKRVAKAIKSLESYGIIEVTRELHNTYSLKQDLSKGYGKLPKAVMTDEKLSAKAKAIYMIQVVFAGNTGKTFLRRSDIMRFLGIANEKTYRKHYAELLKQNYLTARQRYADGRFGVNDYQLIESPDADNYQPCVKKITFGEIDEKGFFVLQRIKTCIVGIVAKVAGKAVKSSQKRKQKISTAPAKSRADKKRFVAPELPELPSKPELHSDFEYWKARICDNIEYNFVKSADKDDVTELVEIMAEACAAKSLKISGTVFPDSVVRSRMMKIDSDHIDYVLDCLKHTTSEIKNIRQYLLTALWNAPTTINNYFTARVNADFARA